MVSQSRRKLLTPQQLAMRRSDRKAIVDVENRITSTVLGITQEEYEEKLRKEKRFVQLRAMKRLDKSKPCYLLEVPAEVRNIIYYGVLVEDGPIHISPTSHEQPGLLRTCRQIRNEASRMFIHSNTFSHQVIDMRPVLPLFSTGHWIYNQEKPMTWMYARVQTTGRSVPWDNLMSWIKDYVYEELPRIPCEFLESTDHNIEALQKIFDMVDGYRSAKWTWAMIQPMLGLTRSLVAATKQDNSYAWV